MTPADELAHAAGTLRGPRGDDAYAEIQRLHDEVRRLERERDAAEGFAALAAHELMAPLVLTEACVSLAGERLSDGSEPELLQALQLLGRGAGRTRRLIEALLHEARASGLPLRNDVVDMAALTHECVDLMGPDVEARDASIIVGPLPEVRGEAELLGGLMTNLLANALKFSPRRGSVIRVGAHRGDGEWVIFVESEGPPIPDSDRERIFRAYHRGRGERRARGVGLGLAICSRIAERHGGRMGVVDVTGDAGNRFFVALPD